MGETTKLNWCRISETSTVVTWLFMNPLEPAMVSNLLLKGLLTLRWFFPASQSQEKGLVNLGNLYLQIKFCVKPAFSLHFEEIPFRPIIFANKCHGVRLSLQTLGPPKDIWQAPPQLQPPKNWKGRNPAPVEYGRFFPWFPRLYIRPNGGAGFLPSTLVGGFNPSEKY